MYVIQTPDGQLSRFFTDLPELQRHVMAVKPSVIKAVVPQPDGSELLLPVAIVQPQVVPLEGQQAPRYTPQPPPVAPATPQTPPHPSLPPEPAPKLALDDEEDDEDWPEEPLLDEDGQPLAPSDKRRVEAKYSAYSSVTLEQLGETPLHEVTGVASPSVGGSTGRWVVDSDD